MKIAFYYDSIDLGGQQTQTLNIMRELRNMGHELVYLYSYGSVLKPQFDSVGPTIDLGVKLESGEYRTNPIKLFRLLVSLRASLKRANVDYVISGSALGAYLSGLAAKSLGIQNFWYVGGQPSQVFPTFLRHFSKIKFDSLINGYFGWQACFEELQAVGASGKKFIPIPSAVDTDLFKKIPSSTSSGLRVNLGIPEDALVIGWVGRVAENMQVWKTLELFDLISDRYDGDVYLLIVGGGPALEVFIEKAQESEFFEKIVIIDWIPYEEVATYINVMDIVPLLEEDPQGGSILRETMACGRVALSVDGKSGTQRSFMVPGTSVLVNPEDYLNAAVDWILSNSSRSSLDAIGDNAMNYAVAEMSFSNLAEIFLHGLEGK